MFRLQQVAAVEWDQKEDNNRVAPVWYRIECIQIRLFEKQTVVGGRRRYLADMDIWLQAKGAGVIPLAQLCWCSVVSNMVRQKSRDRIRCVGSVCESAFHLDCNPGYAHLVRHW